MKLISTLLMTLAFTTGVPLSAFAADDSSKASVAEVKSPGAVTTSDGEVKKIDKDAGKITIKHGPLPNLDMPGMTMVFRVKDAAMLDQVKSGDKVKFIAEKINGALTVVDLQAHK